MKVAAVVCFVLMWSAPAVSQELPTLVQKANKAYSDGDLRTALTLYHRAAKLAPDDIDVRLNLGVVAVNAGAHKLAETSFRAVLSAKPKHKMAVYNLGLLLSDSGRHKEALKYLKLAIKLIPNDPAPTLALGTVYIAMRKLKAAETLLKRMTPQTTHVLSLRAFVALRLAETQHAQELAKQAHVLAPQSLKVAILRANVMIHSGLFAKAENLLQQLVQSHPGGPANLPYLLGLVAFLKGDFSDARSWHMEADSRAPGAFDPAHPAFDPNAFPTQSDIAFLGWAKTPSSGHPPTSQRIVGLRAKGKNCHLGTFMAKLAMHMKRNPQCQQRPSARVQVTVPSQKKATALKVVPPSPCWTALSVPKTNRCHFTFEAVPAQ